MLKRLARARVPLGFALATAVLYLARPSMGTLAIGFPIALAGIIFRGAAAGVIRKNAALAQQGPYRMTRNPLYFGSFLLALGFAVMSGSLGAALLLVVPSALIYPVVIKGEEAYLRDSFHSEFDAFCQSVPCFLPRRLDRKVFESFSLDCYLANREYNAAIGFVATMVILLIKYVMG